MANRKISYTTRDYQGIRTELLNYVRTNNMSKNTQFHHPQLFRYLSDAEQESLIGGQISPQLDVLVEGNSFFQKTDIETEGKNDLKLASGDSSSQTTKYKLSQVWHFN